MELISKEDVLYILSPKKVKNEKLSLLLQGISNAIDKLPVVTTESKPKGKWIEHEYCSECGYWDIIKPYAWIMKDNKKVEILRKKFCPNCGAEMESE